jgi:hypothetical protein
MRLRWRCASTGIPACSTARRTLNVNANFALGNESYFGALVAANVRSGYAYRDASQYHLPRTAVPWLQLVLVPANTPSLAFEYSLWNEYLTTNNTLVPIQGGKKTLSFRCSPSTASCSGDIAGGPWSAGNPYATKGSGFSGVELKLYFTSTPAAP